MKSKPRNRSYYIRKDWTFMKIDKKALNMLSSLPDDSLWKMICAIGAQSGIDLSQVKVSPQELAKLRSAMGSLNDCDISRAIEIIESAKKENK